MRLLVAEDDPMIGAAVARGLKHDGFAVDWVQDGRGAELALAEKGARSPRARSRVAAQGRARRASRHAAAGARLTPVLIVLTARDALGDRVAGLDAGADDYLVKPFELDELGARIRAVLRRQAGRAMPVLSMAASLDPATPPGAARRPSRCCCRRASTRCSRLLMQRPGAVLSRAQLEDRLYGWGEEIESNAVSVYVHQLRRKLGDDFIRSMRGVGYFLDAAKDASA